MNKLKKILSHILLPPFPPSMIIAILSFVFVGIILFFGFIDTPAAYIAYALSTYGLYLVIRTLLIPAVKKIKALLCKNKYIALYFNDISVKARVALYSGTAINLIYAVFKLITGIVYTSYWIAAIALYYLALGGIKFILVSHDRRIIKHNDENTLMTEWKSYRLTGRWLLLLNTTISGIIIQVVRHNQTYTYPGTLIFVYAAYAFYQLISALIKVIKAKKVKTPLFRAATAIDFSVAITAMFTLQTAMLSSFSNDTFDKSVFNIPTGICVSLIIFGIAVFMIVNARKNLKTQADKHN